MYLALSFFEGFMTKLEYYEYAGLVVLSELSPPTYCIVPISRESSSMTQQKVLCGVQIVHVLLVNHLYTYMDTVICSKTFWNI